MDLAAEAAGRGQLQMDDQQQADYNRMKTEAGAKTAKMAQDLSSLQVTQKVTLSPCLYLQLLVRNAPSLYCQDQHGLSRSV